MDVFPSGGQLADCYKALGFNMFYDEMVEWFRNGISIFNDSILQIQNQWKWIWIRQKYLHEEMRELYLIDKAKELVKKNK